MTEFVSCQGTCALCSCAPTCNYPKAEAYRAAQKIEPNDDSPPMDWPTWHMEHAKLAARKSKDSTKVGAALVNAEGVVLLTAFNGPPKGVYDVAWRRERPAKYLYAQHAERNLVNFAAREGIRTAGCTVFVTHTACAACAGSLIQAGIVCIVCGDGTTSMPDSEFSAAAAMCKEAGVPIKLFTHGAFDE